MKRMVIALIIAVILMTILGTSVVYAGAPDSIIVVAKSEGRPTFDTAPNDGVPPPEITIALPNGHIIEPGPPDSVGGPSGGF